MFVTFGFLLGVIGSVLTVHAPAPIQVSRPAPQFPANAHWQPSKGPPGASVRAVTVMGASIFAGTDHGLYKSNDGGESWTLLSKFPLSSTVVQLTIADGVILAATQQDGILRSDDAGEHWSSANTGLPRGRDLPVFTVVSHDMFLACAFSLDGGLFASPDAGRTWIFRGGCYENLLAVGDSLYGSADQI